MNHNQENLKGLILAAEAAGRTFIQKDLYRPKFHLTPPTGWMNDPNGLCWYKGSYHVFFQYRPLDAKGTSNTCWGHWTSPDLLEWTQQPVFLYPTDSWDLNGAYSGSALVEDDALYLYYTGNVKHPGNYDYINEGRGHNVGLAVTRDGITADSNDCILENKDYPSNLSCHVRDPKVWKLDGKYYMVLGARTRDSVGQVLVWESEDKRNWKHINTIETPEKFGFMWECPDLFCIDGQWVLMTSPQGIPKVGYKHQNVYSCGYFPIDGDFRGDYTLGEYHESDAGFEFYAPQTFVTPDGRRVVIGWVGMPDADYTNPTVENGGWNQCLSVPRELTWENGQIQARPIRELQALRENGRTAAVDGTYRADIRPSAELVLRNSGDRLKITVDDNVSITWSDGLLCLSLSEQAGCGRDKRYYETGKLECLQLFVDTSCLELFINNGEQVMTTRFYPTDTRELCIEGRAEAEIYDLKPMTFHWAEG